MTEATPEPLQPNAHHSPEAADVPVLGADDTTRNATNTVLGPKSLRECYETFDDFRKSYRDVHTMLDDVLALHPEEKKNMTQIIDEAILLYERPYQYHNAIHMLTTLCFAMDRAIRVNELQQEDEDIVEKTMNVVAMVAYHDTGNKQAPRANAVDETEAIDHFLDAVEKAPDDHPLHFYATPEGQDARNSICAALLASFFRDRYAHSIKMAEDFENEDGPKKFDYVKKMAERLEIDPPYLFASMVTKDKYGKLMKNADISSSVVSDKVKNLFLNHWEDLQRENSMFVGLTAQEYDLGFKLFITGKFVSGTDDPEAIKKAEKTPFQTVPGIGTDEVRDARMLEEATQYKAGIFKKHDHFINLVFAHFNLEIAKGGVPNSVHLRLPELFSSLQSLQADSEVVQGVFLRKKGRLPEQAAAIQEGISSVDLASYIDRAHANGLDEKCWAQLTESDISNLLGEPEQGEFQFAKTAAFPVIKEKTKKKPY